jgi:hypothetical protein
VSLDPVLVSGGDYLDDEERERLHESLREGIRQMKAGRTVDAATVLAELRAGVEAKVEREEPPLIRSSK